MSVVQIDPTPGAGSDYDLAKVSTIAELGSFGRDRVSLTEWATTTVPQVAQGSIIEAGGAIYQVNADSSITVGSVSDGDVYIVFDTNNLTTAPFYFTNTVPVWDDAKQGYYDTSSGFKVLAFRIIKSSTTYTRKDPWDVESRLQNTMTEMFNAYRTTQINFVNAGAFTEIANLYTGVNNNYNNSFNTTTGRFTAQAKGYYKFETDGFIDTSGGGAGGVLIIKNSTDILSRISTSSGVSFLSNTQSITTYLNVGEYVSLYYNHSSASGTQRWYNTDLTSSLSNINFYGYKIG